MVEKNRMTGVKADIVQREFVALCKETKFIKVLETYKRNQTRLDNFWMDTVKLSSNNCKNFVEFVKVILTLSHGNACVERGFSVNSH